MSLKALQSITVAPEPFTVTVKAFVLAIGTKNRVTSAIPLPITRFVIDVQPTKMPSPSFSLPVATSELGSVISVSNVQLLKA